MNINIFKNTKKEETGMGISKKLEEMFSAIAFAEAGELDTAQAIMKAVEQKEKKIKPASKDETVMPYEPRLNADSAA